MSLPTAFDDHADVARAAHRALLVDAQPQPRHGELAKHQLGDALGQGLDQLKLALPEELQHALRHGLVVQRIAQGIRGGGTADVGGYVEIEDLRLVNAPLPIEYADYGVDSEVVYIYN